MQMAGRSPGGWTSTCFTRMAVQPCPVMNAKPVSVAAAANRKVRVRRRLARNVHRLIVCALRGAPSATGSDAAGLRHAGGVYRDGLRNTTRGAKRPQEVSRRPCPPCSGGLRVSGTLCRNAATHVLTAVPSRRLAEPACTARKRM